MLRLMGKASSGRLPASATEEKPTPRDVFVPPETSIMDYFLIKVREVRDCPCSQWKYGSWEVSKFGTFSSEKKFHMGDKKGVLKPVSEHFTNKTSVIESKKFLNFTPHF